MFYYLYDFNKAIFASWKAVIQGSRLLTQSIPLPAVSSSMQKAMQDSIDLFDHVTSPFYKPSYDFSDMTIEGKRARVVHEVIGEKPFCKLAHFHREGLPPKSPKVFLIAPLAGHHATLLRDTLRSFIVDHDVYLTDWVDPKNVKVEEGDLSLESYIDYLLEFVATVGANTHIVAVCQPAVPVLAAVSLLADRVKPVQPLSLTLLGGFIDAEAIETPMVAALRKATPEWVVKNYIEELPFYYKGAGRKVYPGYLQLQKFLSFNMQRHVMENFKQFQNLVRGDGESLQKHIAFYDEFLAVMDVPAGFFLDTVERVYRKNELVKGVFRHHGELARPEQITKTPLFVVEGEFDELAPPGVTRRAVDLCTGLPEGKKKSIVQKGVGHFGIFSGSTWREFIYPQVRDFIASNSPQKS